MWNPADSSWFVAAGGWIVVAGFLILGWVIVAWRALEDSVVKRLSRLAPPPVAPAPEPPALMRTEAEKRGKEHRNMVEVSERYTSPLLEAARDLEVAQARIENALLLSEWLRAGGSTTAGWGQIVAWKQAQLGKGAPTDKA
jgi:hypothetical protein